MRENGFGEVVSLVSPKDEEFESFRTPHPLVHE